MKDQNKKKFKLGDIIRRLNEERISSSNKPIEEPIVFPKASADNQPLHNTTLPPEETASKQGSPSIHSNQQPLFSTKINEPISTLSNPRIKPLTENTLASKPISGNQSAEQPRRSSNEQYPSRELSFDSSVSDEQEESEFDIMHYIGIMIRRRNIILFMTLIVGIFSLVGYLRAVKVYTAQTRLLFAPGYQDIMGDNSNAWISFARDDLKFNTHLELLRSNAVLTKVCEQLNGKISPGEIASKIIITRGDTKGEKNDIVNVSFKHTDAMIAQGVANQVCKTYIDYIKEVNGQDVTRLIFKLEDQVKKVAVELDNKENMLREFKEKNHSVELSTETNISISKLSSMELELQKTQLEMIESRERFTNIKKEITQQDIDVIQSRTYSNPYQEKLAGLELQLNSLSAEYSPEHFKVKMVKSQIDKLKESMQIDLFKEAASKTFVKNPIRESLLQAVVNLTIEKSAVEAKRIAQEQIIKQLDGELGKLPTIELQFAQLTRETESLIQILKLLKTRFEEAKIKRDSQESDLKVLEWATLPKSGISSVQFTKVLLGLLIGLIIGIAIAFILEFLDQSIKDPKSVETALELPLLGIVPMIEMDKAIIDSSPAKWKTVLEPFRALRATLKHLATTRQFKTLIICSAVKGEGKTTLAANLAITFSLDGKKVILVDGDLRRAQMHTLFNIEKYNGLSDYLLGTKEVHEILKPTVHENLSVITAGEHPNNPSELIGSARFDQLVNSLRAMADYIIFDSPALLPVSDGLSMAPKIDACIMVVRALWTPLKAAQQAKNQLKRIGCNMVGSVLNGISHSRGYYPYYYGYYRYYAYKYSYEDDSDRPKPKLTIRELGLGIENTVKTTIRATIFSMPKHIASVNSFLKYLLKKKLFWILFSGFLLTPLFFSAFKFFGGQNHRGIQYVDKSAKGINQVPNASNGARLEQIIPGRKVAFTNDSNSLLESAKSFATDTLHSGTIQDSQQSYLFDTLIRRWEKAFNLHSTMSFLSLYDSLQFSCPSGGFEFLKKETSAQFDNKDKQSFMVVDSLQTKYLTLPYCKTSFPSTLISGNDTLRRTYTLIWQLSNNQWRIIREKHKDIP